MGTVNVTDDPADSSPLHYAAAHNDIDAIDALAHEPEFCVNLPGALDMSPLMTALIHNKDEAAIRLIELGADVNQTSIIGSSPLMATGLLGNTTMVQTLLDHGAAINYQIATEAKTKGWTALSICTLQGQTEVVKLLLDKGADDSLVNGAGQTPLVIAQLKGHADIVALLTDKSMSHGEALGWSSPSGNAEADSAEEESWTPEQIAAIESKLASQSDEERTHILMLGLIEAGHSFTVTLEKLAGLSPIGSLLRAHCLEGKLLFARWLSGETFTDRADEAERRVLTLQSVIANAGDRVADLLPALSRAIMQLPEGHPRRNDKFALETQIARVELRAESDRASDVVLAVTEIVEMSSAYIASIDVDQISGLITLAEEKIPKVKADEVIHREQFRGEALAGITSDIEQAEATHTTLRRQLRSNASNFFLTAALHARDNDDLPGQQSATKRAFEQLKLLDELGDAALSASRYFTEGALQETNGNLEAAADAYAQATIMGGGAVAISRQHEGRLRLQLGQYSRAKEVLKAALPHAQAQYIGALEQSDIASNGSSFSAVSILLAFSSALDGDWDRALQALDQSKSLRLRHRSAMRASSAGRRVLEIEAALYNIDRGIEPPAGSRPPAGPIDQQHDKMLRRTLYLEEYRKVRPEIPENLVESPSIASLAQTLGPDEGIVMIGVSFMGTMMALVTEKDISEPRNSCVLSELTYRRLFDVCADWRGVMITPEGYKKQTYADALEALIPMLDDRLGQPLRKLAEGFGLNRLTIVPHLWLHGVPFWALPSLAEFSIAMAPSAGQLVAARSKSTVKQHATVVGDPTLDLPLSRVEASFVSDHFSRLGIKTDVLVAHQATQEQVVDSLSRAGWMHFCGHGRSDMLTPSRAALLLPPVDVQSDINPVESALAAVKEWGHSPQDGRYATLTNGGRLYEIVYPDINARDYFLEFGNRDTLWARYSGDDMTMIAELWRAGDITAEGQFSRCRLVFLSACDVGGGCLGSIYQQNVDEFGGIPGALQLADVACTVASLWPVADDLAMVFVELFYSELTALEGQIDIASIIKRVSETVRELSGDHAANILQDHAASTDDLDLQFRLEASALRMAETDRPFSHPVHWAAFFATGARQFSWL